MLGSFRLYLVGAALFAAAGLLGAAYFAGRSHERAVWMARNLETRLQQAQADIEAARRAEARAGAVVAELRESQRANQERLDEYDRTLAGRDPCALSDDDVRRLRELGGQRRP